MGSQNRLQGIDDFTAGLIRNKAHQLVHRPGFTEADREDLEQELVLDLLRRLPYYDPARTTRKTFITRLVDHKVATLIESRRAASHDVRRLAGSLDASIDDRSGQEGTFAPTLAEKDFRRRGGNAHAEDCPLATQAFRTGPPPQLHPAGCGDRRAATSSAPHAGRLSDWRREERGPLPVRRLAGLGAAQPGAAESCARL